MSEKLVSMKLTKSERKEMASPAETAYDGPEYPYGLQVNLDDDTIEKLGLAMPKVGGELTLTACVRVTSVASSEHERGSKNRSVSLQITDMAIEKKPKSRDEKVAGLYER